MSTQLSPGANTSLPSGLLTISVNTSHAVDVSAYGLALNGKVRTDEDMVFYGQPQSPYGSVQLRINDAQTEATFRIDTERLSGDIKKISIALTCDATATISQLGEARISVSDKNQSLLAQGAVDVAGREEAALIMGELYFRNGAWKFRFVAQGFNGGLKPLAEHFGVTITEEAPTQAPPAPVAPPPAPPVSLSKVSLTKERQSVSLAKKGDFGRIRINLDWNQTPPSPSASSGGLLSGLRRRLSGNQGIDLDLGAFIRYADGAQAVIQALGESFGDYDRDLVHLLDDDRTGASVDGEWLHINGSQWDQISEVLIYAFIYEGAASWNHTDGVVTIHAPDQAPIETRLTEGSNGSGMCAIARLVNERGAIRVERINRYFKGHSDMDQALNWGFSWKAGSK